MTHNKEYLGMGSTSEKTLWKITVGAPEDQPRRNVIVSDEPRLSSDFGDFLSISKMVIKKENGANEEVLFDNSNNIHIIYVISFFCKKRTFIYKCI